MPTDPLKARAAELSFKKFTQGLTPAEEAEYQRIKEQLAQAGSSGNPNGG